MADKQTRLQYLYVQFINDKATAEEVHEFWDLMMRADKNDPVKRSVFELYGDNIPQEIEKLDWNGSLNKILGRPERTPVKKMYKWLAAASVLVLTGIFGYFYPREKEMRQQPAQAVMVVNKTPDVAAPASNRATISLANGQTIFLDSTANGLLATQNNVQLKKTADGEISYSNGNAAADKMIYNTLANPRGSRVINITLSDGTRLWLNSGSSVIFPVTFGSKERKVNVTGEAYFEVAHDPSKKFIVTANNLTTEVLGTHFNVHAFNDEAEIKVTLAEGSVKVSSGTKSFVIKPGEQAVEKAEGGLSMKRDINVEEVIAWKNEMFTFNDTNIKAIMKEVARWYDVDIQYKGDFSDLNFGGNMSRQKNVSELLKRLEATKTVRFEMSGKTITVIQIK